MKKYIIRLIIIAGLVGIFFPANFLLQQKVSESEKPVKFAFEFPIPEAVADKYDDFDVKDVAMVRISGSFNGWDGYNTNFNMLKVNDTRWEISLPLSPGRYAYKYIIFFKESSTAIWSEQDKYPEYEYDGYNGRNCVINIPDYKGIRNLFELIFLWLIGGIIAFSLLEFIIRILMRAKISLQLKIALILTVVGLMVNVYILVFNQSQKSGVVKKLLENEARLLLVALENNGVDFSKMSDGSQTKKIFPVIDQFMGITYLFDFKDKDQFKSLIKAISVCDSKGILLTHTYTRNLFGAGIEYYGSAEKFFEAQRIVFKEIFDREVSNQSVINGVNFYAYSTNDIPVENDFQDFLMKNFLFNYAFFDFPIIQGNRYLGFLHFEIASQPIAAMFNEMLLYNMVLLVVISVLYFILLTRMGKVILEPMHELIKGMNFVKEGHLDYKVIVNTRDEIADMGDAYNFMSSELKKSYDEITEFAKGLEVKVAERTHELSEANEKLKELDKIKTRFFANISHELRTPLTLIMGPVESILGRGFGEIDPQMKEYLYSVYNNSLRLMKLINNLLDFAKLEAGRMIPKYQPIPMVELLRFLMSTLSSAAESKNLTIDTKFPPDEVLLYLDKNMMEKVIMNLLSNAFKFTDRGGIKIVVFIRDEYAVIEVRDTGIGIPADKLDKVFERFSQVDGSESRRYEGTGIGLALVKELVELQMGTIDVESELGAGTTFRIMFKLGTAHIPPEQIIEQDSDEMEVKKHLTIDFIQAGGDVKEAPNPLPRNRQNIPGYSDSRDDMNLPCQLLITDDNPDMRKYIQFLLKDDYSLVFAKDGQEGLDLARQYLPDLVISDVMMPRMNGYEFCGALKSDPALRHIPFILLTAKADLSGKLEGLEYGADDYLSKPFNPNELAVRIRNLLKNKRLETELSLKQQEIEKDLQQASAVQKSILTPPAVYRSIEGFEIETVFMPMNKSVSGDYYHISHGADGKLSVMVADMSGHGVQAALSTMQIDALNRETMHYKHTDERLEKINYLFLHNLKSNTFCSAFLASIQQGLIEYSTAAHPAQYLIKTSQREIVPLKAKGKLLCYSEDSAYELKTVPVSSGDILLLFSDGIFEEFSPAGEEWGEEGFMEAITMMLEDGTLQDALMKDFLGELTARMDKHLSGVSINDDITMIGIRVK